MLTLWKEILVHNLETQKDIQQAIKDLHLPSTYLRKEKPQKPSMHMPHKLDSLAMKTTLSKIKWLKTERSKASSTVKKEVLQDVKQTKGKQ